MTLLISIWTLFAGVILMVMASFVLSTVLALQAASIGYSDALTGLVMAGYYLGFVAGTYLCPQIIKRIGQIRTFSAAAAILAVVVPLHVLTESAAIWFAIRLVCGGAMAALYLSMESWLNALATPRTRGRVFGSYQSIILFAYVVAPLFLLISDPLTPVLLLVSAALFAACLIPVAVTNVPQPPPVPKMRLRLRTIWKNSPLGVVGTAAAGLANATMFALAPVYGLYAGMSTAEIAILLSVFVAGGGLLQWPLGHLSDYVDRRLILVLVGFAGFVLAASLFAMHSYGITFLIVTFLYGGATFALYPLAVAHSNDFAPPGQGLDVAKGMLLAYGIGAVVGPLLTGIAMALASPREMFLMVALFQFVPSCYGAYRMTQRAPVPADEQHDFVPMVRTTQADLPMHPQIELPIGEPPAEAL